MSIDYKTVDEKEITRFRCESGLITPSDLALVHQVIRTTRNYYLGITSENLMSMYKQLTQHGS